MFATNELMSEMQLRICCLQVQPKYLFHLNVQVRTVCQELKFMSLLQKEPTLFFAATSFLACQPDFFVVRYKFKGEVIC